MSNDNVIQFRPGKDNQPSEYQPITNPDVLIQMGTHAIFKEELVPMIEEHGGLTTMQIGQLAIGATAVVRQFLENDILEVEDLEEGIAVSILPSAQPMLREILIGMFNDVATSESD